MIPAEEIQMSPRRVFRMKLRAEAEDEQHGRADGIEMLQRIEGQTTHGFGRGIPHAESHPAVGQFVDDDGIQKRNRQQEKRQRILNEKLKQTHITSLVAFESCVQSPWHRSG
jgi:hypothetical protein